MISYLSIGSGKVVFNDFPEKVDFNLPKAYEDLKEDLLQITYGERFIIDVGWYPSFDIDGKFTLYLIENYNWEKPIYQKRTRDIKLVLNSIEEFAIYIESKLNS